MASYVATKNTETGKGQLHLVPAASTILSGPDDPYDAKLLCISTIQIFLCASKVFCNFAHHRSTLNMSPQLHYLPHTMQHSAKVLSLLSLAEQYKHLTDLIFVDAWVKLNHIVMGHTFQKNIASKVSLGRCITLS